MTNGNFDRNYPEHVIEDREQQLESKPKLARSSSIFSLDYWFPASTSPASAADVSSSASATDGVPTALTLPTSDKHAAPAAVVTAVVVPVSDSHAAGAAAVGAASVSVGAGASVHPPAVVLTAAPASPPNAAHSH